VSLVRNFTDARPNSATGDIAFIIVEGGSIANLDLANNLTGFEPYRY
ncbi:MAG: hypothetical protein F6K39_21585, partial [Okeania sp. SIO3B3]|nr:hypothetical protein [Okeania sp. SIO3B3]